MLKQITPFGCGLYAVANALNDQSFITDQRLIDSRDHAKGNNIGQLSRWLAEDKNDFYIDVFYYNHHGLNLPKIVCSLKPVKYDQNIEKVFLPVLLAVTVKEKDHHNHMVGGVIDENGKLYLYDSLKKFSQETTLWNVNKHYYAVYGLYLFCRYDGTEQIILTNKM